MRMPPDPQRTLKDILDSDDELTTDYTETGYVPAYQDDTRFQALKHIKGTDVTLKDKPKALILNTKDAFCFQCMQRVSKDICKWFIKFTIYKDLQSNYKFLQSCLIPKYESYQSYI